MQPQRRGDAYLAGPGDPRPAPPDHPTHCTDPTHLVDPTGPTDLIDRSDQTDLTGLTATRIAELVQRGDVSALEVTYAHLRRIAEDNDTINAVVRVDGEHALRSARTVDRRRRRGAALGPLAGVPFVVKDNIDVRRQVTACGSLAADDLAAPADAPAIARLRVAGAVLLGRANMDELAMGASTRTSAYGATSNPWDPGRSPGGSSGGSSAAVAAEFAAFSIGTDTGGSIREPAAHCDLIGVAPSPGLVPLGGVVPFAPDLDRVGPLTRSATDAATLIAIMAGRRAAALAARPAPTRVGVVTELCGPPNQPGVRAVLAAAIERLRVCGVEVVELSVPDAPRILEAYMIISSAACVPHVEPFVRTGRVGPEVVRRWELGRELVGSAELAAAREVQRRVVAQASLALAQCGALLSPTMPTTAPSWESLTGSGELTDPLSRPYTDCWTVVANLAGLPALSMPAGCSPDDGMPVGVMLTGAAGSDFGLLRLAAQFEAQAESSTLSG